MASFLHATDFHFGNPENSLGIAKSWKVVRSGGALPVARSLLTVMATHDRDVVAALRDLIVELGDGLDAVLFTGDIATTSAPAAMSRACDWLLTTAAMAGNKRTIALPGNHDRFHPFPSYAPGAVEFERAVGVLPAAELPAPVHGVGAARRRMSSSPLISPWILPLRPWLRMNASMGAPFAPS